MKTPTTIAVVALHVAIVAMILIQPSCKSSEESINPDLTAPEQTPEVPVAVDGTLPPEGSDNLRAAPTRPVYALPNRGVNEVPTDTFVQPEEELIAPTQNTFEPEVIEPKISQKPAKTSVTSDSLVRHTIKSGDNLTKIAKNYNTTVNAIMEANGIARNHVLKVGKTLIIPVAATGGVQQASPTAVNETVATTGSVSGQPTVYVVQKGDSLSKIAGKFNTSVGKIMNLNGMNKTSIREGQKLKIPAPTAAATAIASGNALTHKVASGETLGGIAIKHKVPLKTLMETNGISDPRKLRVGQVLVIKKDGGEAAPTRTIATEFSPSSGGKITIEPQKPILAEPVPQPTQTVPAPQQTQVPAGAITPAPEIIEESIDL